MADSKKNICFIGGGSIATAMGNVMAVHPQLDITLISIEEDVVRSINNNHINHKYFPNIPLHEKLFASTDTRKLKDADIIFLAIPSAVIINYLRDHHSDLNDKTIIVNLAKGFGDEKCTIAHCLEELLPNPVVSMKGPTFARDLINGMPTAVTIAARDETYFPVFQDITEGTNLYLDFSTDLGGVEILSILKNIYAIALGIADANFNSANLRFLLLTKAFKEMNNILLHFGGERETMFKYCGYGDFSLTALNDLSRNRTLGLLIGKGFFTKQISDNVILEGHIAINVFCDKISKNNSFQGNYIMQELYKVFNENYDISSFVGNVLKV